MEVFRKAPRVLNLRTALASAALLASAAFAGTGLASGPPQSSAELPGARETQALEYSYPGRIMGREIRSGEWSLLVGDRWFLWAGGRLLPQEAAYRAREYVPIRFYTYYRGPRRQPSPTPEQVEILRARNLAGNRDNRRRSDAFLNALYGFSTEAEADRAMVQVRFLGRRVRVHPLLVDPLARADRAIRAAEAGDPALQHFIRAISQIQGFHWREIAGTERRSFHAYGAAIDIVPKTYGGRLAYWRWAFEAGIEEWWTLPERRIWMVPQAVIDAMEAEGFVWGGKWLWFDTVHFEFRPEVLRMAN